MFLLPSHDINDGHYVSECHTHAMMRHSFNSKQFWGSCGGDGGVCDYGTDTVHHNSFQLTALI